MIEFNYGTYPARLKIINNTADKVNSRNTPFFVASVENNVQAKFDISTTIESLENGDKTAVSNLEKLGYSYSLEEREDGYKVKFEADGVKHTISYVDGSLGDKNIIGLQNSTKEELDSIIDQLFQQSQDMFKDFQDVQMPVPPMVSDYATEKEYADAFEKYKYEADMYEQQVREYNRKIASLQLAGDIYETQAEMLGYEEILQDRSIPNPPIKTESMSEAEYSRLMKIYEMESAEYQAQSALYDLRRKMLDVKMSSTVALLDWLTSKLSI